MSNLVGIATWNFQSGSLAERIERFVSMGYNSVALISADARALCGGNLQEVERLILKHSLHVAVHAAMPKRGDDTTCSLLLRDFEMLLAWHCRTGLLHTVNCDAAWVDREDGGHDYDEERMREVLSVLLDMSRDTGVTVGVEDWPRTPQQLAAVADLLAYEHYGVLIDLGHLNMRIRAPEQTDGPFPREAAQAYLEGFKLPVNELHVHNNNGKADQHAPPTLGTADMRALAGMLKQMNVRGVSTIELVPAWAGLSEEEGWAAAEEARAFWQEVFFTGDG